MVSVGLDGRGKSLVASAVNERQQRVFEGAQPATRAGLRTLLRQVGVGAKLVVFEAGNQLKWIAETLKKLDGVQIHVVHPNEVKWITESRGKTDRVDAKKLAELARAGLLPRAGPVVEGPVRLSADRQACLPTGRGAARVGECAAAAAAYAGRVDQYHPGLCVPRRASAAGEILYRADLGREAGAIAGERPAAADP
jgi:hypothetical protein